MSVMSLLLETFRAGFIASLVIIPLGPFFKAFGLRIGHYGPKFAALFIGNPQTWHLLVQHFLIGWISTVPFLISLRYIPTIRWRLIAGALYGALFYVTVNSLALPLYFRDPTPWQLGWSMIYPSLIGHVAFGFAIAVAARRFALPDAAPDQGLSDPHRS